MPSFNEYLAQGNPWLFFPIAVFLGALHGLEPGHSKTMMTAYIVAIRGTVWQAFLLGVSVTISHTAIIWILAFIGFHYSTQLDIEEFEAYFQLVTGIMVIGLACWMLYRTRQAEKEVHSHDHGNGEHGGMMVGAGNGWVEISVFETNVPPRFRLYFYDSKKLSVTNFLGSMVTLETIRLDGSKEIFDFVPKDGYLEASNHLPEPHEFKAVLTLAHDDHIHTYKMNFVEHHHALPEGVEMEFGDAHERVHAMELEKHLASQKVTTGQIILFGLTGGLLPCPSAFAVLLVCLQLKKVTLGFAMVLAFSIGLAITLVTVGAIAAISVNHATRRLKFFGEFAYKLPYASSVVLIIVGLLVAIQGLRHM